MPKETKAKCWEILECEEKKCPAYKSKDLRCWLKSGTHCRGEIQGKFIEKIEMCLDCKMFTDTVSENDIVLTLKELNKQVKQMSKVVHQREEELEKTSMELALGLGEHLEALKKLETGAPDVRTGEKSPIEVVARMGKIINHVAASMEEMVKQSHEMAIGMTHHFDVLNRLSSGDVEARVVGKKTGNEVIDKMSENINHMGEIYKESVSQSMELSLAIAQFLSVFKQVGEGNMVVRAPIDFELDALTALSKGINMALDKVAERAALEDLLKELSTPVLYTWEGVIVMPLIGTLTSERAQDAMERLLNSITKFRAKVAIVDITGVPVIDSMVAQHLIKTVKAVKILGSEAIITGISAEVASILVKIGIEVEQFITRNTLREGLQYAIKMIEGKS